ncbi:MAG TPA: hypothetical protein VNP72_07235 [Longimicrobium sp.]|nr:hypothetical protein [Longimicrobium sp.]
MYQDPTTHAPAGTAVAEQPQVPVLRMADPAAPAAYQDVFVRDNFGDTGTIPTAGGVSQSPDIIPYGTGILDLTTAASTYAGSDIGQNLVLPGTNNIYVRAKNLQPTGTETARVALYWASSSLFLLPQQWKKNRITAADGTANVSFAGNGGTTLSPNDICLTQEAFYASNVAFPSIDGHPCLIAVVNTPNTTVKIPDSFASFPHFVQWVQNNPAVAWRNVNVVPNTVTQILQKMKFGNLESQPNQFLFSIIGRNVPAGTTVSVQCTDLGCPINQQLTMPAPYAGITSVTGFPQVVPANFQGAITLTASPPAGTQFPANARLTVAYYLAPPPPAQMTALHAEVSRVAMVARVAEDGTTPAPAQESLIPVGECSIDFRAPQAS